MEGVYRLSPNARIIEALKAEFDKSEFHSVSLVKPSSPFCHLCCSVLLIPTLPLPSPLLPAGDADLKDADPASVSCLLKLFLVLQGTTYVHTYVRTYILFPCPQRELPEPLIPMGVLQQVVDRGDSEYFLLSKLLQLHTVLTSPSSAHPHPST